MAAAVNVRKGAHRSFNFRARVLAQGLSFSLSLSLSRLNDACFVAVASRTTRYPTAVLEAGELDESRANFE